jgi:hypothetical protein
MKKTILPTAVLIAAVMVMIAPASAQVPSKSASDAQAI